ESWCKPAPPALCQRSEPRRNGMSLRHTFIAGLIAGSAIIVPAAADEIADGVATLPGAVEDVRVGGTWDKDGKTGAYRIVVARTGTDKITARMFVQWVAYDDAGGAQL